MSKKPVLIELDTDDSTVLDVSSAPPVPDAPPEGEPGAPHVSSGSRVSRWFWSFSGVLVMALVSIAAWNAAIGLLNQWPLFGLVITAVMGVTLILGLIMVLAELSALSRMARVDRLRHSMIECTDDLTQARKAVEQILAFYRTRKDMDWARARLNDRMPEVLDPDALISLTEDTLLEPLDQRALREVEKAARQVATVTAVVPLALADVLAVLVTSSRMIRSIAQIYGGRSGFWSSWRLTRSVLGHLAATGVVAIGDDLIEPLLGGSVVSKLSRRFGEGLVNGALTARVGLVAMELCRPMPFTDHHKPSVRGVIRRALTGVFDRSVS